MACLICGAEPTIKAHLMPKSFTKQVSENNEAHAISDKEGERWRTSQGGLFDKTILCEKCDRVLGRHEEYGLRKFDEIRKIALDSEQTVIDRVPIDGDKMLRFASGIVWKYSATSEQYGRIDIGPYRRTLAGIAFSQEEIPKSVDGFFVRPQTGDDEVYFYRAPKLDRKQGVNMVRFSMSGFVFFLKIDKRPRPVNPPFGWLRGSSEITVAQLPATNFEEGRIYLGLRDSDTPMSKWLDKSK